MFTSAFRMAMTASFDPRSLAPALWLDAADPATLYDATSGGSLVAADGAIARWEDKSGNARHATQATSGYRPLRKTSVKNGRDCVRFDGVTIGMSHPLGIVGDNTVFMVVRSYETTSYGRVFFSATAPNAALNCTIREDEPSGQWGVYRVEGPRSSGQSIRGDHKIISSQSVGVTGSLTTNGAMIDIATSTGFFTDAFDRRSIGFSNFNAGDQCNCSIAEIIVYPTALSADNRQSVERYLSAKWAIALA